ncbi:conserved hypothetical protein [Ricinus communis]|uniref:Uncharacterized protein n=1 Tax=Ricinus communis TaxID=3988 RepID=B9SZE1_RICCO|nr:conserved hypothetical protein [Ricinus communis]
MASSSRGQESRWFTALNTVRLSVSEIEKQTLTDEAERTANSMAKASAMRGEETLAILERLIQKNSSVIPANNS